MARIRTIKPSFWSSRTAALTTRDARLLAVGLISMADDEGRFIANHSAISGYVYPHDADVTAAKLAKWLRELEQVGFVVLYQADGIKYGAVNFKHQVINRRHASTFPAPPTEGLFSE